MENDLDYLRCVAHANGGSGNHEEFARTNAPKSCKLGSVLIFDLQTGKRNNLTVVINKSQV